MAFAGRRDVGPAPVSDPLEALYAPEIGSWKSATCEATPGGPSDVHRQISPHNQQVPGDRTASSAKPSTHPTMKRARIEVQASAAIPRPPREPARGDFERQ